MWHVYGRGEMNKGFRWGSLKERDLGVDWRKILNWR
jgi:hypothetical protein